MATAKSLFLCNEADLAPGSMMRVDRTDGPALAVYNIEGRFYATDDCCTHALSSLSEGMLEGDVVECSLHFGGFHVPSGKAVYAPCTVDLRTYPVDVRDGQVFAAVEDA
jgi:nitrite reductase/ring-hydroxylating ferredoxin subunit